MTNTVSERAIVFAPKGRDAEIAIAILTEAGIGACSCATLPQVVEVLSQGAGFAVFDEEFIRSADLGEISYWIENQPEWSDFPIVLLTRQGGGLERNPAARRYLQILGNVTFVERPFHPTTFVSIVQSSLRGRRRQYEARSRLEELHESRMRYQSLFNSMDEGFAVIELIDGRDGALSDYVHVEANPAFEANTGMSDIIGKRLREVVSQVEADEWASVYRDVLLKGEPVRFERELVETGRALELGAFPVESAQRQQVAVLFKDISARKSAEARLHQLNQTLEEQVLVRSAERDRLWNLSQDMLARADYNGMMSAVSPAWAKVLGWTEEELLSRGYATFMHPEDRAVTIQAIAAMAEINQPTTFENRIATKSGDWKSIEWTVAPEPDGINFIAVGRDLSAAKARADELRIAQDNLRQSQKLEAIGQLTGGVAHDFNNLLMAVLSSLALLRKRVSDDPAVHRLIDNAVQGAERGATLTQRMLAFARRQDLAAQKVNLRSLVHDMTGLLERTLGPAWPLSVDMAAELPDVLADSNQIEMALLNLAVNARDAMEEGGEVQIRTLTRKVDEAGREQGLLPGIYVGLSVVDNGNGMDAATLERATEPFFTTKGLGKGTGLGLPMVHGLAMQLGGTFQLASDVGHGTTATLWLPAANDKSVAPQEPVEAVRAPIEQGSLRILVVDDDALVLMNTVDLLEDLGHEVIDAHSGELALSLLRENAEIDLLMTDQAMPGMTGSQLVREVSLQRPNLPVILATGYGELPPGFEHTVVKLSKPFSQDALEAALVRAMTDGYQNTARKSSKSP